MKNSIKDKVSQYFIGDAASIKSKFINLISRGEIFWRDGLLLVI